LRDHREVLLLLVPFECLAECGCGFVSATGGVQHLGEVAECVALHVQRVCAFRDRDGLAGELLCFGVLFVVSVDERLQLPPLCSRPSRPSGSAS
jgi:hypothetical protein